MAMLPTRKPTLRVAWYISTNQASEHTRSNWSGTRKNKSITTLVLLLIFVLKLNQKRNNKRIKTFILWTFCFWKVFGAFDFVSVVVVFSFTPVWSLISSYFAAVQFWIWPFSALLYFHSTAFWMQILFPPLHFTPICKVTSV